MAKIVQFIPKNCVHYYVEISQDTFGVAQFQVTGVDDTPKDRKSVAWALRQIAEQLEKSCGECESN